MRPYCGKTLQVIGLHDFHCYLHVASWSLTPVICHVLMHCFGSFLLLSSICFQGTKYEINREDVLFTCLLRYDAGPGCVY